MTKSRAVPASALRKVPKATHPKRTPDQEEALRWVRERARPRDTKKTALPEAEGAAINEPSRPAKPAERRRRRT